MKRIYTFAAATIAMCGLIASVTLFLLYQTSAQETVRPGEKPSAEPVPGNATEVGAVHWMRDFDAALAQSEKSKKPVLALFQEVPG